MDYRQRTYYLITINYYDYNKKIAHLKQAVPSLKMHEPYNHFTDKEANHPVNESAGAYDGEHTKWCGHGYWQMMVSCKKEDVETLEYEFEKANKDFPYSSEFINFLKINKLICGQ